MITQEKFIKIKEKYGFWSSWAVWSEQGTTPKSNVGDLSIFDGNEILKILNPNVIFVGLNISRGAISTPLANFHDRRTEATDFKIRYAFKDTQFWGGYMTDIIKDYDQVDSVKVMDFLKENRDYELANINFFKSELNDIESIDPILIAFGSSTQKILKRHFKNDLRILSVSHYAHFMSKETYRDEVINKVSIYNSLNN